jgi:hypothetical protein
MPGHARGPLDHGKKDSLLPAASSFGTCAMLLVPVSLASFVLHLEGLKSKTSSPQTSLCAPTPVRLIVQRVLAGMR